ncbi:MAG: ethylbenzene dehydrogenase-related protein [Bacteroidota bacterium]
MNASTVVLASAVIVSMPTPARSLAVSPDRQDSLRSGRILYAKYCSTCHGSDGSGSGTAAIYLNPKPRDFTRGIFKFQSTPAGSLPTDEDLLRTLKNGMPGSPMPAWDRLTDQQRTDLVTFVKEFCERFKTEPPAEVLTIATEPPSTPDMIRDGKAVYALAGCWMCHGKSGLGDGPSSGTLVDDLGRPIRPYNFTRAGAFKGGGAPRDIYRTFSTGIGGTPMPGYGEEALTLGQESISDLTALESQYTESELQEIRSYALRWPTEKQLSELDAEQRKALAEERRWALVYYVLSLSQSSRPQISYTTIDHQLTSVPVAEIAAFRNPSADVWQNVKAVELPLISLWQRDTPTDRVSVQTVNDGTMIAFRLQWEDPTQNDDGLHASRFGDAAAIQFPLDPASDPFFGMGDTSFAVNIWQWKSWWDRDLSVNGGYAGVNTTFPRNGVDFYPFDVAGGSRIEFFVSKDSARNISLMWNSGWASRNPLSAQTHTSSIEDLNAHGFGSLTPQPPSEQTVNGTGVWNAGTWSAVFVRALTSGERSDVVLKPGTTIPAAFAVWDGSLKDRNGQKMVTNWYQLTIGTK